MEKITFSVKIIKIRKHQRFQGDISHLYELITQKFSKQVKENERIRLWIQAEMSFHSCEGWQLTSASLYLRTAL